MSSTRSKLGSRASAPARAPGFLTRKTLLQCQSLSTCRGGRALGFARLPLTDKVAFSRACVGPRVSTVKGATEQRSQLATSQLAKQTMPSADRSAIDWVSRLGSRFTIPAPEVKKTLEETGMAVEELLTSLIIPASKLARPPISNYYVGAVGLAGSGAIYLGVNLEFPGLPLNNSVHAEQCLVVNLLLHNEESLKLLAVSAAPCGHCRQFYSELVCADTVQFIFGKGKKMKHSLDDILPERFGPADLLPDKSVPLLLQKQDNQFLLTEEAMDIIKARKAEADFQRGVTAAILKCQQSFTPYTRCPAGVALVTRSGDVFSGSYAECAAYNPGLPPFQAAIVDAVIHHLPCYDQVKEVVLVQPKNANVEFDLACTALSAAVCSNAPVTILPVTIHNFKL